MRRWRPARRMRYRVADGRGGHVGSTEFDEFQPRARSRRCWSAAAGSGRLPERRRKALGITKVTPGRVPRGDQGAAGGAARLFPAPAGARRAAAAGAAAGERRRAPPCWASATAEDRSDGEKLLVTKAGADKADPLIRYVVDDEFGAIAHKDKGFADWVMFWRRASPRRSPALTAGRPAPTPRRPIDAGGRGRAHPEADRRPAGGHRPRPAQPRDDQAAGPLGLADA